MILGSVIGISYAACACAVIKIIVVAVMYFKNYRDTSKTMAAAEEAASNSRMAVAGTQRNTLDISTWGSNVDHRIDVLGSNVDHRIDVLGSNVHLLGSTLYTMDSTMDHRIDVIMEKKMDAFGSNLIHRLEKSRQRSRWSWGGNQ